MKVRALHTPKVGMTIFNGSLVADVTEVSDDGSFQFDVYNGLWIGWYTPSTGELYVPATKTRHPSAPFFQVSHMEPEERWRWYHPYFQNLNPIPKG